jgi:hypothetical protein
MKLLLYVKHGVARRFTGDSILFFFSTLHYSNMRGALLNWSFAWLDSLLCTFLGVWRLSVQEVHSRRQSVTFAWVLNYFLFSLFIIFASRLDYARWFVTNYILYTCSCWFLPACLASRQRVMADS